MFSHVTIRREDYCVTLLDLPGSIEDAQASRLRIRSAPAPTQPYPSTEPKGNKLDKLLRAIDPVQLQYTSVIEAQIEAALEELHFHLSAYSLPWCLPRITRVVDDDVAVDGAPCPTRRTAAVPVVLSPYGGANVFGCDSDVQNNVVANPSAVEAVLEIDRQRYIIPPRATFVWSSIADGLKAFEMVAGRFDLIVLDPPWSNRSVRRSARYDTRESQKDDPFETVTPVVGKHLSCNGLVAVWVTNKAVVRTQVLAAMRGLGLELQTEVVWLKISSAGQPLTTLRGVWRKPYEALLIFCRQQRFIQRQVIVAVPDVHSRKPSLKRVLEPFLPAQYTALEIFARSLTAGWWSWGDEVLKFQDSREWE